MPPTTATPTPSPVYKHPNPIYQQLADARDLIRDVARGELVVAAIEGPPGLGKTHLAEGALREAGLQPLRPGDTPSHRSYLTFSGTPMALIYAAYSMRNGGVILLDDADSLYMQGGLAQANMMKRLLAPDPVRWVENDTQAARLNEAKASADRDPIAPPRFATKVRFVICTNQDFSRVSPRMRLHIEALVSRGLQSVRLSTDPRDHLRYVLDLIHDHDLLMRDKVSLRIAQDVADWFRERAYYLPSVSVRAVLMAADMRRLHSESWRRKVERDIRAEPVADPRDVPERRIIVPRSQRPGYVPPVASARTLQRREQREAAKRPDAQSRKDALQVFRIVAG